MSRLYVRVLGTPDISMDEVPLPLNHAKARALLFFLAATGERHARDYLASLLWSEAGPTEAHHSLRSSLYRLRHALDTDPSDPMLVSEAELLSLRPSAFSSDALEFRRLLQKGDEPSLNQAVALVRGPFLQGFYVPNAGGFEEWVRSEDSFISQSYLQALERLASWAEARQDWLSAVGYLQQMLQIDPLAENAQQRLMGLYLRVGELSSVLRQYRRFESVLRQELDLEPSPETQALLHEALQRRLPHADISPAGDVSTRRPPRLPFMGRAGLLRQLEEISLDVQAGRGATILIEGEGGIGKTRLLDEFSVQLTGSAPPWMVLRGACTPFDDLRSQGPFVEALDQARAGDLTELASQAEGSVPDARGRFPWHVLQTIRTLCKAVPVMLIVEDLQWADSSTLNLFGFLAMRLQHLPVALIGTVQQPEAIPALQRLIGLQRHRGALSLIHLTPLSLEELIDVLCRSGIDPASAESLGEWLVARSGGNPFLLTEILAQMWLEDILLLLGGRWQLQTTRWLRWRTTFVLPETTHDLVAWRLANLDADAQRVLDILAMAGQPLPEAVLRAFPEIESSALELCIDDLAGRGLVAELPGALLALPHHLLREALLHRLSSLRRRSIYRQLARAWESSISSEDWQRSPAADQRAALRQIAQYAVAGEDVPRAHRYGLQALPELPQEYTGSENIDFVQHLYDLLVPTASPDEMLLLTRILGTLHQSIGRLDLAAQWFAQNLEWARRNGDWVAQADVYFDMAELALASNDYHAALTTAETGLSRIPAADGDEPSSRISALVGRGHRLLGAAFAMEGSDLVAAERHLYKAMEAHRQLGSKGELCATLFELGNIAAQRGQLQRAIDLYSESAQAAETARIYYYLALASNNAAYHSLLLGQIEQAQRAIAQGIRVAEAHGLLAALLHLYSTQGEIHLYLAEWELAEESFQRGLAIADELGSLERQAGYRGGLALAARGRNDLETAIRLLSDAVDMIAGQGYWHLRTRLQIWYADSLRLQKRDQEALSLADEAIALARTHQRILLLVQGLCLRATLLAGSGDWSHATAAFTEALDLASSLELPLEVARVQAAWGRAMIEYSPSPADGKRLIGSAREVFTRCDARAELTLTQHVAS